MKSFLLRTMLGGLFVVLPVTLIAILIARAVSWLRGVFEPFAAVLPFESWFPGMWAVVALVGLSFVAGLALRVRALRDVVSAGRDWLTARFPFLGFLRGFEEVLLEGSGDKPIKAALAEIEEALVPAVVVEELADGRYVVFVPAVPSPFQGALYILARERVHLVDASVGQVVRCVTHWGVGSAALVRAMRQPAQGRA